MPLEPSKSIRKNFRRKKVADLYLQGWTQSAIAAEVGVTQPTVSVDLKKIQETWRNDSIRDFDLRREIELQKIDRVEREAWSAWERSQKPDQTAYTIDEPNNRRTRRQVRNRHGDPRFLDAVLKCITARRELLGLDAPAKMEIETHGPTDVERSDRLIAIAITLRERQGTGPVGAGLVVDEPRIVCADREPGTLAAGPAPQLPRPGDRPID